MDMLGEDIMSRRADGGPGNSFLLSKLEVVVCGEQMTLRNDFKS